MSVSREKGKAVRFPDGTGGIMRTHAGLLRSKSKQEIVPTQKGTITKPQGERGVINSFWRREILHEVQWLRNGIRVVFQIRYVYQPGLTT